MKAIAYRSIIFISALALFWSPAPAPAAGRFTPPGLYDVEQLHLANGMRVLLKQRGEAHNVAIRLVVSVGSRHFGCALRETPHLLEHLLFSGTSKHSEAELDRLIAEHGGSWNAVTGLDQTTFRVDIFDEYADLALGTLYEIMTDTTFTPEKIAKAKEVVTRELGGKASSLRRLLYRYGIGKTAWQKASEWLLPGEGALCSTLADADAVPDASIVSVFRAAYTPENMTLIVVGNFDRPAIVGQIRRTFGVLPRGAGPYGKIVTPPLPSGGPVSVSGTFAPFLGSSGYVGAAFRTEGSDSPDAPALTVLSSYLDRLLYELVRVERGLSYNPEVAANLKPDYGILSVTADAALPKLDRVRKLIEKVLARVSVTPPTAAEVELTKQKILLQWVQGYETNAGLAGFYARSVHDLIRTGRFPDYEHDIEAVTAGDVVRVVKKYLVGGREVLIRGVPSVTYTRFFTVLLLIAAAVLLVLVFKLARTWRRRARVPWYRR